MVACKAINGMYLPPYFFLPQHIIFKKILCCGKFVTTHYFLSHNSDNTLFFQKILCCAHGAQHNIFEKKYVLWQVCHNTLLFESQHIIFSKKIFCCGHG